MKDLKHNIITKEVGEIKRMKFHLQEGADDLIEDVGMLALDEDVRNIVKLLVRSKDLRKFPEKGKRDKRTQRNCAELDFTKRLLLFDN